MSGLQELTTAELAAVEAIVRALVAGDVEALRAAGGFDDGADPWLWTRDYGDHGRVELVVPPGDPRDWDGAVYRSDTDPTLAAVEVDMWTAQEGRSDLTLQLDLVPTPTGAVTPTFRDLHVL